MVPDKGSLMDGVSMRLPGSGGTRGRDEAPPGPGQAFYISSVMPWASSTPPLKLMALVWRRM